MLRRAVLRISGALSGRAIGANLSRHTGLPSCPTTFQMSLCGMPNAYACTKVSLHNCFTVSMVAGGTGQ